MRICKPLLGALIVSASCSISVLADEDYSEYHPVTSMEAMGSGSTTANSLEMQSEYAVTKGNYERAIKRCRQAINKDNDDLDVHMALAQALEAKLKAQDERDPELFKECVKEWVTVLRAEAGDEKGLTFHGVGFMGERYADSERSGQARAHLIDLTGSAPKGWETSTKYIKRVTNPANQNVNGKVVSNDRNKEQ